MEWVDRLTVLVIGPGLGRDSKVQEIAKLVIQQCRDKNKIMVIDGDGLWTVEQDPSLIKGYGNVILTPNVNEYSRLCKSVLGEGKVHLADLANTLGVTIVKKGEHDIISNGKQEIICSDEGGQRRCGGIGDVLAGCIGCFASWSSMNPTINPQNPSEEALSPLVLAAYGGCSLTRHASKEAFQQYKRSMVAHDILQFIGPQFNEHFESESSM
eukprot:TRINITY_DN3282_c0_g1_i3.p1 TRINITY_DN3282_c0_g1~~TRINITY_DN3282_c0_g1_i3.p1  ORF type:complete len:212 (-),score=24.65 TRINITY_DN3282_c0_g1_i3:39-674(-)